MSEHHHYHNSSQGFTGGLLLGALLGAGITLLLGTKRGKEITEELKEKGLSLIGDFDELFDQLEEHIEEEQTPLPPAHTISLKAKHVQETQSQQSEHLDVQNANNFSTVKVEQTTTSDGTTSSSQVPTHIETLQTAGRRLFHGIPKRR